MLNIFYGGTKKPLRKIKDITNCGYLSNRTFFIEFKLEGKLKQIVYEVKNVNVRNEIVGKIKYLMVRRLIVKFFYLLENESKWWWVIEK